MYFLDIYRWYPSKLWIGGIGTGYGNYVWVTTGEKFNFTNWSEDEPDRENDDQQCAALHAKRMTWYIKKCSGKRGLICEGNRLLKAKHQELSAVKEYCADQLNVLDVKHKADLDALRREVEMLKITHENETKLLNDKATKCNSRIDQRIN